MDPVSIIGLVGTLVKVINALVDVKSKYSQSNITISAIVSECSVISAALTQIDHIANRGPEGFSSSLDPGTSHLGASVELALGGCFITLAVLNEEVEKLRGPEKLKILGWRSKAKYIWNEGGMKDLLVMICGQQSALYLLVTAIQTCPPNSQQQQCRASKDGSTNTNSTREESSASTIGASAIEFAFDDQIVSSEVYKRAFRTFVRRSEIVESLVDEGFDLSNDPDLELYRIAPDYDMFNNSGFTEGEIVAKTGELVDILNKDWDGQGPFHERRWRCPTSDGRSGNIRPARLGSVRKMSNATTPMHVKDDESLPVRASTHGNAPAVASSTDTNSDPTNSILYAPVRGGSKIQTRSLMFGAQLEMSSIFLDGASLSGGRAIKLYE